MLRHRLAVLALLVLLGPALTQDKEEAPAPPAGTWKVMWPTRGDMKAVWLFRFEKKGDAWTGAVVAKAPGWLAATIDKVSLAKGVLRFMVKADDLSVPFEVRVGEDAKADKMRGSASVKKSVTPLELYRTGLESLDPFDVDKEALAREPLGFEAVGRAMKLLSQAAAKKAKPAEVRAWAEKAVRSAELYGEGWQRDILVRVAEGLGDEKGFEAIALQYARRAERSLEGKEPPAVQKRVLETLAAVLEKGGKADDAKAVLARVAKLDFRIKPTPFAGRKGKSGRVVLVELFTGSQAPTAAAPDLALDALAKRYKPTELATLRYHTHYPRPDPLVSPDAESRVRFYEEVIRTPPLALLDGKPAGGGGGAADEAAEAYDELVGLIDPSLEKESGATIKVKAARKGDKVSIAAEVSGLAKSGDDVRLRVALVEDGVAYKGASGLERHSGVVRHMPGGADGTVMKEKAGKFDFAVDLAKVKKDLAAYLKGYAEKRPFPDKEQPLELKALRVVAFVQDDKSGEVLQAVVADVANEKE